MNYLFILGRNLELSIAEIRAFFEDSNPLINFSIVKNGMLASFEKEIDKECINNLGGTIAIGEVVSSGNIDKILKCLDKTEVYTGSKKNFNYVIWNFSFKEDYDIIENYLKKRFKFEKFKPTRKNLSGVLSMQSGKMIAIPHSLTDEEFFILSSGNENFFGKIISKTNYSEIEKRDMQKPVRREKLAISPRLAKIMINISKAKEKGKLVDPFCGVGVILQEALLLNKKVIGIDKDSSALESARQNLQWGKFNPRDFELINEDSSRVRISGADVIVTEPELGVVLKAPPSKEIAEKILFKYENLMIAVLNNLKKNIKGRIVFTAPFIRIKGKEMKGCNAGKITSKTGLRLTKGFPIDEFREKQTVGRQIFVMERK